MDKLMVWGAWGLMAAVGSLSAWKISQTPKVDPIIATLETDLNRNPHVPRMAPPPALPAWRNDFTHLIGEPRPMALGCFAPAALGEGRVSDPPPRIDVFVLPFPVVGEAKADLLGTTVTWTLQEAPKEKLATGMTQKVGKPAGFIILRQRGTEKEETLAKVGPEVRSYTDASTQPLATYRYRILVMGEETHRSSYPAIQEPVTKGLPAAAAARTPSNVRLKLIGGDKTVATLRVETYDRTQKKWIAKTVMAAPGRDVGSSGWTLNGLRFDNFTLVADLTDDDGVARVLTTKN